jgi:tetratricopeptide (TPR) repeat protein
MRSAIGYAKPARQRRVLMRSGVVQRAMATRAVAVLIGGLLCVGGCSERPEAPLEEGTAVDSLSAAGSLSAADSLSAAGALLAAGARIVVAGADVREPELAGYLAHRIKSARREPHTAAAVGNLALAYDANGFASEAIATYQYADALQVAEGGVESRWPHFAAILLAQRGDFEEARESIERAIAIDSDYLPQRLWLGTWLLDTGDADAALAVFRDAEAQATSSAHGLAARFGHARALMRLEQNGAAVDALESLTRITDQSAIWRLLARAYRSVGRADDGHRAAARGRVPGPLRWPDSRRAEIGQHVRGFSGRLSVSEDLISAGRFDSALALLAELAAGTENDRTVINNLSIALQGAGRTGDAIAALQRGITAHPDYYLYHFNLAALHERVGDAAPALRHLARGIELQPGFMPLHERKVALHLDGGDYAGALAAIDDAARHGPPRAEMLFYAGVIEGNAERWQAAITRFKRLIRLEPGHARAFLFLGRSHGEAGEYDAATKVFARAEKLGADAAELGDARRRLQVLARRRDGR